jgi:hypothetical protein
MRPRTRQLELRGLFSHHLLHVFSTLSLAANSWSICSSIRPEPHPSSSSHTPLSLHDIVSLSLSPLPTALLRSTDQCSPLVTILACLTRTAPSTLSPRSGPYLTSPSTTAKQNVVAHRFHRLCLYRLIHCAVAVSGQTDQ